MEDKRASLMKMKIYYICKVTYTFDTYILAKEESDDKFSDFYLNVVQFMTGDITKIQIRNRAEQLGVDNIGMKKTDIAKGLYNFFVNENLFRITPEGEWQRYDMRYGRDKEQRYV